jgi:peptidase M28-like protein
VRPLVLILLGPALVAAGCTLPAQTRAPESKAAATITAADVAHRIGIMADDSMMGRDTPSRGLDLTAQYVANEFREFGLKPGGDDGSWIQQYSVTRRRLDRQRSFLVFRAGATTDSVSFTNAARYEAGPVLGAAGPAGAVLVGGKHTSASAGGQDLRGKLVLYVAPSNADASLTQDVLRALFLTGPKVLMLVSEADERAFSTGIPAQSRSRIVIGPAGHSPLVLQIRADAVARSLSAAGIDLAGIRAREQPLTRKLPRLQVEVAMRDSVTFSVKAPNSVGILEGSDPALRDEYVVYSAHMDHIGISPGMRDSINNGADDDASGTAGIIELAEAFSQPGARPKRSIIFLGVSGEEKGLWGSDYFTAHPPVPLRQMVANLNLDMIGRNWRDTIVAIGKEHSDLGATLDRVNRAHPELGMTAIDDLWPEERFYHRSDHYNFARRGVPVLFFFNGVHQDYHQVSDSPDKIDSEKEARILRLLFYLGQEIANAPERPQWNPKSYAEIVQQ